jgi:hypothetical protein
MIAIVRCGKLHLNKSTVLGQSVVLLLSEPAIQAGKLAKDCATLGEAANPSTWMVALPSSDALSQNGLYASCSLVGVLAARGVSMA